MSDYESSELPIDSDAQLKLIVSGRRTECGDVAILDLSRPDGAALPAWSPGAHIALRLGPVGFPEGTDGADPATGVSSQDGRGPLIREYSLCGSPLDRTHWTIAVRLAEDSRGGSAYVHRALTVGTEVVVTRMGNLFPYVPGVTARFLAAGIGVTPILPMIEQAELDGTDWTLTYLGHERAALPLLDRLAHYGDRVRIVETGSAGRPDIVEYVRHNSGTHIFCCGPEGLLDDLEAAARDVPDVCVSVERFSPRTRREHPADTDFEVVIDSSKRRVPVRADQTTLSALLQAGVRVMNSCGEGTCGSCETAVLAGIPDHRDSILTDEEREANEYMYVCVSRSLSPTLILDL